MTSSIILTQRFPQSATQVWLAFPGAASLEVYEANADGIKGYTTEQIKAFDPEAVSRGYIIRWGKSVVVLPVAHRPHALPLPLNPDQAKARRMQRKYQIFLETDAGIALVLAGLVDPEDYFRTYGDKGVRVPWTKSDDDDDDASSEEEEEKEEHEDSDDHRQPVPKKKKDKKLCTPAYYTRDLSVQLPEIITLKFRISGRQVVHLEPEYVSAGTDVLLLSPDFATPDPHNNNEPNTSCPLQQTIDAWQSALSRMDDHAGNEAGNAVYRIYPNEELWGTQYYLPKYTARALSMVLRKLELKHVTLDRIKVVVKEGDIPSYTTAFNAATGDIWPGFEAQSAGWALALAQHLKKQGPTNSNVYMDTFVSRQDALRFTFKRGSVRKLARHKGKQPPRPCGSFKGEGTLELTPNIHVRTNCEGFDPHDVFVRGFASLSEFQRKLHEGQVSEADASALFMYLREHTPKKGILHLRNNKGLGVMHFSYSLPPVKWHKYSALMTNPKWPRELAVHLKSQNPTKNNVQMTTSRSTKLTRLTFRFKVGDAAFVPACAATDTCVPFEALADVSEEQAVPGASYLLTMRTGENIVYVKGFTSLGDFQSQLAAGKVSVDDAAALFKFLVDQTPEDTSLCLENLDTNVFHFQYK